MNKKIYVLFGLICLFASFLFPLASADSVYLASNSVNYANGYGQVLDTGTTNASQTFTCLNDGRLWTSTITLKAIDDSDGANHPSAYFRAGIYAVDGTNKPNSSAPIEISDDVQLLTSTAEGYYSLIFQFDEVNELEQGTMYAYVISATYVYYHSTDYFFIASSDGGITGQEWYLSGGVWTSYAFNNYDATTFFVFGDDDPLATPTPTPTPSPTPEAMPNWISDIIDAIIPIFTPLLVIFICGALGWRFAGAWGFFAGINLAIILVYVIAPTYMPLWAIVAVVIVDIALLFGKVGFDRR